MKYPKPTSSSSLALKLASLAGAVGIIPAAHAAVVTAANSPITPPNSLGTNTWDVDGSGYAAFNLVHGTTTVSGSTCDAAFLNAIHGAKLVVTSASHKIANLATGDQVGAALDTGKTFDASPQLVTYHSVTLVQKNFNGVPGFFGFSFQDSNSLTYYGWGNILIDGSSAGSGFTIQNAYYDNIPGTAITVGDMGVPEPSGIALLALGSVGLAAWRLRKKKA